MNVNKALCLSDITPFSLLDYSGYSSAILWFSGCNLRCLYCYNPEVVLGKAQHRFEYAIEFLQKRVGLLDAVVFSGGECTNHKYIIDFIREVKCLGFKIKIDTNGTNPEVIVNLVKNNLVDFIALDYKAPQSKFKNVTQTNLYSKWESTFSYLLASKIPFEIRTTFHQGLLNETDIQEMNSFLYKKGYRGNHYIQNFRNNTETLAGLEKSEAFNYVTSSYPLKTEIRI